jgi:drug/metabolite transporter (DMT)-like permease
MALPADRRVLPAFGGVVLLGGTNLVLVVYSTRELDPMWAAGLRFGGAALVAAAVTGAWGLPFPRGRSLVWSIAYGFLAFALGFGLFYWGAQRVPAGVASVIMGSVPLLTLLLALVQRLERFRPRGLAGALFAIAGIAVVSARAPGGAVPLLPLLAVVGAAATAAESAIVVRRISGVHPMVVNTVGLFAGAFALLGASFIAGEAHAAPGSIGVGIAVVLMALSTPFLFTMYVFVVQSWSASAAAYQFVLFPLVSIVLAAILLDEPVSSSLLLGAPLVLIGVYVGALSPDRGADASVGTESPEAARAEVPLPPV